MTELEALTAVRALFPTLMALSSLALVPLIRLWRGSQRDDAATYATFGVQLLLLITSVGAALAGAGYLSTLKIGQITIDPSEPGRLLVLLGGIVFAVIVGAGEGAARAPWGRSPSSASLRLISRWRFHQASRRLLSSSSPAWASLALRRAARMMWVALVPSSATFEPSHCCSRLL